MKSTKRTILLTAIGAWILLWLLSFGTAVGQRMFHSQPTPAGLLYMPFLTANNIPNWVWRGETTITLDPVPRNQPKLVID